MATRFARGLLRDDTAGDAVTVVDVALAAAPLRVARGFVVDNTGALVTKEIASGGAFSRGYLRTPEGYLAVDYRTADTVPASTGASMTGGHFRTQGAADIQDGSLVLNSGFLAAGDVMARGFRRDQHGVTKSVGGAVPQQILRPIADITVTGFESSRGGAVDLFSDIDEATTDDADFASCATATGTYETRLAATIVAPAAGAVHVFTARERRSAVAALCDVLLVQGATTITTRAVAFGADNAFTTSTYTLTAAEVAAITNYADLRLRFAATNVTSTISVSQAFLTIG